MLIGDWITIRYRNDRFLFGDDAAFDVIVAKRAIFHLNKLGRRFALIDADFFLHASVFALRVLPRPVSLR